MRNNKGFMLISALMLGLILSIMASTLSKISHSKSQAFQNEVMYYKLFYLADSVFIYAPSIWENIPELTKEPEEPEDILAYCKTLTPLPLNLEGKLHAFIVSGNIYAVARINNDKNTITLKRQYTVSENIISLMSFEKI